MDGLSIYGLTYLLGVALYAALPRPGMGALDRLQCVTFVAAGAILGGRLGYAIIYEPLHYLSHPHELLEIWRGGMSFHGGIALAWLSALAALPDPVARRRELDRICALALLMVPLGRVANFLNGELWGRPTSVPWAVVFLGIDDQPRHPSQLYEALCEGPLLLPLILLLRAPLARRLGISPRAPGLFAGIYLMGYALARIFCECFREPDLVLGFLALGCVTMGQALSVPLLVAAAWHLASLRPRREKPPPSAHL